MIEAVSAMSEMLSQLRQIGDSAAPGAVMPDPALTASGAPAGTSFSGALKNAIERVDGAVSSANGLATSFASGNHDIPLSDVMVSLEQANLALQLAANVRDKVVGAYTNVMNMQL